MNIHFFLNWKRKNINGSNQQQSKSLSPQNNPYATETVEQPENKTEDLEQTKEIQGEFNFDVTTRTIDAYARCVAVAPHGRYFVTGDAFKMVK